MSEQAVPRVSVVKRILFFLRFLEIRLRFIMILVVTALLVGYWDHVQNYYERWQRERAASVSGKPTEEAHESEFEYYCGMHPFVVRDRPGKCPICGMDLVQRKRRGAPTTLPEGVFARVQVAPERIMQAGIQVEPVLYRMLARTVRSYGVVEPAETKVAEVIARFPGRVEELMINATGMPIKKGEPLARIYSPEFLQGTLEYVRALKNQRDVEGNPNTDALNKERAKNLVESARKRLSLAGFTDQQLEEVAASGAESNSVTLYSPVTGTIMKKNVVVGQSVEEGSSLYSIADLATLWVQVQVIESDISAVHSGMPVEVTSVAWPGEIFYGTVDFFFPEVDPGSRSLKVRVAISNKDGKLRPGMYVNAVMRSPIGRYGSIDEMNIAAAAQKASAGKVKLPTETPEQAAQYLASLSDGATYFTCSMHPQVMSDKAGDCPLCNMKLIDRKKGASALPAEEVPAAVTLPTQTPEAAAKFLTTLPNDGEYYTCSMHAEVVSDKPGDCPICNMKLEKKIKSEPVKQPGVAGEQSGSFDQWAEGYTCPMHLDALYPKGGKCLDCGCGMDMTKWRIERTVSIPESAVIDTGDHKMVYVESSPGVYDARSVTVGPRTEAFYPVLAGLTLGERIVTKGSFLIDAEARLNPASSGIAQEAAPKASEPAMPEHQHNG